MIRKIEAGDREAYLSMSKDFYRSDAVLSDIPEEHINRTFDTIISGTPYADAYIAEEDGRIAGYALVAVTFSNEAGGIVVWVEEIYIRSGFRDRGLGTQLINFIEKQYSGLAVKLRLEVEEDNAGAVRLYKRMGFERLAYMQMHKPLDGVSK